MVQVHTTDGVALNIVDEGAGRPVVLHPGWCQSARSFRHQVADLSKRCRVIAVDPRGHGESDQPEYGYRISRLAMDLHNVLDDLELNDVTLVGHSLGATVAWNYLDLFGPRRLPRLVVVDQPPCLLRNPNWSEAERVAGGGIFSPESLFATPASSTDEVGWSARIRATIEHTTTDELSIEDLDFLTGESLRVPARHAVSLL